MKYTILKTDGTKERLPIMGKRPTLKELQKAVGGYIEYIYLRDGSEIVVNEEGKYLTPTNNIIATMLAVEVLSRGDYIAGDCVLIEKAKSCESVKLEGYSE